MLKFKIEGGRLKRRDTSFGNTDWVFVPEIVLPSFVLDTMTSITKDRNHPAFTFVLDESRLGLLDFRIVNDQIEFKSLDDWMPIIPEWSGIDHFRTMQNLATKLRCNSFKFWV